MTAPPRDDPHLAVEVRGTTMVLRISNPGRANAVDAGILDGIVAAVAHPPDGVRAILLGGAGDRHFSAGLDLGDVSGDALAERLRDGERRLGIAVRALAACPVPVVAVIAGAAMGGALELAIACDWRIAARTAKLGMPAARLGVVYAPDGMRRFVAAMGPSGARRLFLTGRPLDGEEGRRLGLVDELADPDELWDTALRAAQDVALGAPGAIAGTRRAIDALMGPLDETARTAVDAIRETAYASPEFREGLAAFRERRPPAWAPQASAGPGAA